MTVQVRFGTGKRSSRHWMVCDCADRSQKQCLFDEETALRRGDPPRCIRHGSLLFSHSGLTGMSREQARKRLDEA